MGGRTGLREMGERGWEKGEREWEKGEEGWEKGEEGVGEGRIEIIREKIFHLNFFAFAGFSFYFH